MHGWQSNKEMDRGKNMGERHVAQTKIDLWSNLGQEIKKSQREWDMGAGDQLTPGGFKGSQSTKGDCFETWCDIAILTLLHHNLILTNSHTIHKIILSNMFHVNVNCLLNQSNDLCCLLLCFSVLLPWTQHWRSSHTKHPPRSLHLSRHTDYLVPDKFHEFFGTTTQTIE